MNVAKRWASFVGFDLLSNSYFFYYLMPFRHTLKTWTSDAYAALRSLNKALFRRRRRLHITQPALSDRFRISSGSLVSAFRPRWSRIVFDIRRRAVLTECRALLTHAETIGERAKTLQRGDTGTLKVAASRCRLRRFFRVAPLAERYPKVDLRVIEAVGPDILAMLERGDIHLGILLHAVQAEDRPFGRYVVPPVELLAVCQPSFQLKFGKTIDIRALAPYPLLLLDSGFVVRKTFDAVCRLAKVKPKIAMESRAPWNLLALAEAGHGIAVIPSVVRTHCYRLRVARITHGKEGRCMSHIDYRGTADVCFLGMRGISVLCWRRMRTLGRETGGLAGVSHRKNGFRECDRPPRGSSIGEREPLNVRYWPGGHRVRFYAPRT